MGRIDPFVRKKLDAAPQADFADVVVDEAAPHAVSVRHPKLRRDRRNLEDDEYIAVDAVTGQKVLKTGRRAAVARGEPIILVLEEEEFVDEYENIAIGWKRRDEVERRVAPAPPVRSTLRPDEFIDSGERLRVRKPREILPSGARVSL